MAVKSNIQAQVWRLFGICRKQQIIENLRRCCLDAVKPSTGGLRLWNDCQKGLYTDLGNLLLFSNSLDGNCRLDTRLQLTGVSGVKLAVLQRRSNNSFLELPREAPSGEGLAE